jgi:hypothetical protein
MAQEIANDESETKPTVYATDAVIAHLMAATRASNPWCVCPLVRAIAASSPSTSV